MMQASRQQPAVEQMQSRGAGGTWRTWHTDDDLLTRRKIIQRMCVNVFELYCNL